MNLGLPPHNSSRNSKYRQLPLTGTLLLCLLLLLAACETLESRLTRNQEVLKKSPPEHQALIQQGRIQVGFTPTEVYLAWGAASHKSFTESSQGLEETWFYTLTQSETYYQPERYYDRRYDVWRYVDRPYQRSLEYIFQTVIFNNGAVTSFTTYPSYIPYLNGRSLR